ncbi:MAG: hypothetical protein IPL08_05340 [Saprospiraceae bacterium]|nr:hypothetical protein [Saprospiraceae bacterium]MBL0099119.1 hypothetical protein [Saprospiraceae bacterium]
MKFLLLFLILIHGLIHLMGFTKAFGFAHTQQLTKNISVFTGMIWLLTAILFSITVILLLLDKNVWPYVAMTAAVISQILIFNSWQDAKFGTIANVIILLVAIINISSSTFYQRYQKDVASCLGQQKNIALNEILTEQDIVGLPIPVQKYLRYTRSLGQPKVSHFRVDFEGKIRKNDKSEWMPFNSEQYNFIDKPYRLFFMKAVMKHLPVAGYHAYKDGKAMMDIRLLSLIKVQYKDGPEMDEAETVTFFNDMVVMAPPTLIDPKIQWLETKGNEVRASFTNKKVTIEARLFFNDEGQLTNFISDDRYAEDAGKKLPWSTPVSEYKEINGYKLPATADAVYSYPEGDVVYGTFYVRKVIYNNTK